MREELRRIVDRGERILNGSYGLVEGFQEFNSFRSDIIQWFEDVRNYFGQQLQSPEDLPDVLKSLRNFLPEHDRESY
jgi:hypothetical protein